MWLVARAGVEEVEQLATTRVRASLVDLALGVQDVAEGDRLAGACLLASDLEHAIGDGRVAVGGLHVVELRLDLGGVDALHAVRALLHDAWHADRDVGVLAHAFDLGDLLAERGGMRLMLSLLWTLLPLTPPCAGDGVVEDVLAHVVAVELEFAVLEEVVSADFVRQLLVQYRVPMQRL